jgi:hypothetical protein
MSDDNQILQVDQLLQNIIGSLNQLALSTDKNDQALFSKGADFLRISVYQANINVEVELGSGQRRESLRILSKGDTIIATDDFTLGQHIPAGSEVGICGAITAPILRNTPEFASLVKNTNPLISFKDEEGTGADRMMSKRLAEKMNTLAGLVNAEWVGIQLRVTEAWDEQNEHTEGSLHYEGRAADITTAPQDGAKLGRLARLAVNAGFDWVWYEDSSHVHVAVKS